MLNSRAWVWFTFSLSFGTIAGCPKGGSGGSADASVGQASQDPFDALETGCAEICDAEARCGVSFGLREECIDECVVFQAAPTLNLYRGDAAFALWSCTAHGIAEATCNPAGAAAASETGKRCAESVAQGLCYGRGFEAAVAELCGSNELAECLPCVASSPMPVTSDRLFACYTDDAQLHVLECVDAHACEPGASGAGQPLQLALCIAELGDEGSSDECCDSSDPCGWAEDDYCDCDGEQAWDVVDCEGL